MSKTLKVLLIDDDDLLRRSISSAFRADGWTVHESKPIADPSELLSAGWNVVIYELAADRGYNFDLARALTKESPKTKVVVTSTYPGASAALEAISCGAYDYLGKPLNEETLRLLSSRLTQRFTAASNFAVRHQLSEHSQSDGLLVGRCYSFIEVMKQVGRVAPTSLPVLLTGESGTGKEVIATTLHQRSNRHDRPFIALNCGAIPAELIESELFGHERGSFTGAERGRQGLWAEAAGGTIFLDEITETSLAFQVKLLRAIQHGEIRRVGSNEIQMLDVRVIAASNRDVEKEVLAGRFRQDLFYRLNAVSIQLPPLRERREDIPPLIEAFLPRLSGRTKPRFSQEVIEIFNQYSWPGNVRELEHAVVRAVAMCDGTVLAHDLPEHIRKQPESITVTSNDDLDCQPTEDWLTLEDMEAEYVARALGHTKWNKQATARLLKIDRKTLDRMIKRHDIIQLFGPRQTPQDRRAA